MLPGANTSSGDYARRDTYACITALHVLRLEILLISSLEAIKPSRKDSPMHDTNTCIKKAAQRVEPSTRGEYPRALALGSAPSLESC